MESVIVAFRIEKEILEKFDKLCRDEGIYVCSEGFRKAIISVLERKRFNHS